MGVPRPETDALRNYFAGGWRESEATNSLPVRNPATGDLLAHVPLSTRADVDQAVSAAAAAFREWRRVPSTDRIQFLFRLKNLLEANLEEISRTITIECGKTLAESRAEMRRAIENVETACGIPILMQGHSSEEIAPGIDEIMFRQPIGVAAIVAPFNFPGMILFWFMPYALACGNTCVVKPSEKVPLTMQKIFELVEQTGLPPGVVNLVNGSAAAVDALLDHPSVQSISFVGSTPVARHVYSRAAANGKRAQCQGGAKNAVIILPDADMEMAVRITADSAFGCAGQRCLAASLAVTVGDAHATFPEAIQAAAASRVVGNGLDPGVEMGPVISPESKARVEGLVDKGVDEGARLLLEGRRPAGLDHGNFIRPTILGGVSPSGEIARTEIFGPVLSLMHVNTIDDAIALVNSGEYGNMACIFTSSGSAARRFRLEADAGNIGINLGVAAPMASFPFSGWKSSFFGDLHGQARDAVSFFTQPKVIVERWPREWSRRF
jgi:malonate-semialdehyde dehydrogenase (acetylating)/methylmalonate-semialdehyde dehydrogenase